MSAQSVRELATLVHDLPRTALPVEQPTRPPLRVGLPGVRPFTYRLGIPSPLERTRVAALDTIATALNRSRWELMRQTPTSLEFRRSGNERIVIDLEPNGTTATTMIIHGRAPRERPQSICKAHVSVAPHRQSAPERRMRARFLTEPCTRSGAVLGRDRWARLPLRGARDCVSLRAVEVCARGPGGPGLI
jgi:hypothetical protein